MAMVLELPLLLEGLDPTLVNLAIALVVLMIVLVVGRYVLNLAWKVLKIVALVIGALWLLSVLLDVSVPLF